MSKHAMIANIATKTGETQAAVTRILDALAGHVSDKLRTPDEEVILPGIGKLKSTQKSARTGRNPSTGAAVEIPAKVVAKFVPAKALKDSLN